MNNANTSKNTSKYGGRSTANQADEEVLSSPVNNFRSRLLSGFLAVGGVTALVAVGRASHTLDTAVIINDKQDAKIEKIYERLNDNDIEQNRLLVVIENQIKQQVKSDEEFLNELKATKDKLDDIDDGVRQNKEAIIIMNVSRVSKIDNTKVNYLAYGAHYERQY